jgi:hypothetical protein
MNHARIMAGVFAVLGMLLLAGFGPLRGGEARVPPIAEHAKLDFSYLSPAQVQDLWKRADNYALAEAFLRQCGSPSHVERRMYLAVRDCIEARALNRVAAYFRKKMAEMSTKQTFICDTEQAKSIMKNIRARIDHDVEEVRSMCRSCLFC